MPFGSSRHVVSLIRSPIMTDAVWCTPTWGINYMPYAIMTDADWCIPSSGTFLQCHTPSWRMPISASRQVGHWKISGCLRDGCRLVHPVRRFIRYQSIHIYDGFRLMNPVLIIIHIHSVFNYHISIPYSLSYYLFKDTLNLCTYIMYSFHSYLVNYQFT